MSDYLSLKHGDIVFLRTRDDLVAEYGMDERGIPVRPMLHVLHGHMMEACGHCYTIRHVDMNQSGKINLYLQENDFTWPAEAFELVYSSLEAHDLSDWNAVFSNNV